MSSRKHAFLLLMTVFIGICKQTESNSLPDSISSELDNIKEMLMNLQSGYGQLRQELDETKQKLDETKQELDETKQKLDETKQELDETKQKLAETAEQHAEAGHLTNRREILSGDEKGDVDDLLSRISLGTVLNLKGKDGAPGVQGPPGNDAVSGGAVYVRWGRTTCSDDSTLLYAGFAAGSRYDQTGGGVNYQCMPPSPEYNSHSPGGYYSSLSGSEYESQTNGPFPKEANDKNVPCARCYTNTRSAVMMLPAKRTCPSGWNREYEGYLMAEYSTHIHQTTFECVDANPEYITGSDANTNGATFFFVKPTCSGTATTHHCPPYINDRQLTCVVCSK